ncbi:hypothetical protein NX059_002613 [Plenodomus lindquistii]|nr:hypothetical protein NX059_002613 [Plenodomus lindquistii]
MVNTIWIGGPAQCPQYYLAGTGVAYDVHTSPKTYHSPEPGIVIANILTVSETIGLDIVAFNGGSYTRAIFFTGFMYVGAAAFLWLVRTWKIGEQEEVAAAAEKAESNVDPVVSATIDMSVSAIGFEKSSFVKRMFMWQKV